MTIMTHQFKVGDTGKTRDGRRYRVIATDLKSDETIAAAITNPSGEEYVVVRFATGKYFVDETPDKSDLMPSTPAVYINVYERKGGTLVAGASTFTSREAAGAHGRSGTRIGCIRVELEARLDD
jgi:hypothetical protein